LARIAIFGLGYVGLVTGTCFAELGNDVIGFDTDRERVALLERGGVPIYEPGLAEMIEHNVRAKRLEFTADVARAVRNSDLVFIAVGTPQGNDGHADLTYVRQAAIDIARNLNGPKIVVNKSTVRRNGNLVRTADPRVRRGRVRRARDLETRSSCAKDRRSRLHEARSGGRRCDDAHCADIMRSLYQPLGVPVIVVSVRAAEMIKYTANAFLATKISFVNEIANICEQVGADVNDVVYGAGSDRRIGTTFFHPGLGFGGSCFRRTSRLSRELPNNAVSTRACCARPLETNAAQLDRCARRIIGPGSGGRHHRAAGARVQSEHRRHSRVAALALLERLLDAGYAVRVHDPMAIRATRQRFGIRWSTRMMPTHAPPGRQRSS